MTAEDFIIELLCRIDDAMNATIKHVQSHLYPSEIVNGGCDLPWKGWADAVFSSMAGFYDGCFQSVGSVEWT